MKKFKLVRDETVSKERELNQLILSTQSVKTEGLDKDKVIGKNSFNFNVIILAVMIIAAIIITLNISSTFVRYLKCGMFKELSVFVFSYYLLMILVSSYPTGHLRNYLKLPINN